MRREVARRIEEISPYAGDVPLSWRRWARATLAPKVDYMATIRHAVRRALRNSTLGRYDRTYRRPHRRQACYGEFIMPSFHQPRPRPGFLIDTSGSMGDSQLARAVSELGGLTRQLGYGADVVVACCDAAVHDVRKVFTGTQVELYGGGGTDMGVGLRAFIERPNAIRSTCWSSSATAARRGRSRRRPFRSSPFASATARRRCGETTAPTG